MGSQGLYKLLKAFLVYNGIGVFTGQVIGVDASMLIHILLLRHAIDILSKNEWSGFDDGARDYIRYLKSRDITPIFVFDGRRVPQKCSNLSRAERRAQAQTEMEIENLMLEHLWDQLEKRGKGLAAAVDGQNPVQLKDLLEE